MLLTVSAVGDWCFGEGAGQEVDEEGMALGSVCIKVLSVGLMFNADGNEVDVIGGDELELDEADMASFLFSVNMSSIRQASRTGLFCDGVKVRPP